VKTVKKIAAICIVLLVAMAVVGVGYARWYELLFVDVTVETGEVDVVWSLEDFDDIGDEDPLKEEWSWIEAAIVTGQNPDDTLDIDIFNAYPCIEYYVDFNIENVGTIPVHVWNVLCEGNLPPEFVTMTDMAGAPIPEGMQLHPGEIFYGKIVIHLENTWTDETGQVHDTLEDTTYTLQCTIDASQWNEDPPGFGNNP
jgi:hypothetical protein